MKRNLISLSKIAFTVMSLAFMLGSCGEKKFKVEGEVDGADGETMLLQKSDFVGRWSTLDSVKIKGNGKFAVAFPAPASPEIYRLSLDDRYIYFPIDSTETVKVKTSLKEFGHAYEVDGSDKAQLMADFEKELMALGNSADPEALDTFKKNVYSNYMKDSQGSIVSFYILTKTIDGKPLYNPNDAKDAKYFGAVATGFKTVRPNDPHTRLLEETTITALKKRNSEAGNYREIEADELAMIDIELADETGAMKKLSDIAGKGKSVVVIFSMLTHPDSPTLNYELAQIYDRHKSNTEFYQISVDPDQYAWREAAVNLPWVTVYDPLQLSSPNAVNYNVGGVPAFFVYDSKGELIARPGTLKELEKKL